jgi:hypothetical protein
MQRTNTKPEMRNAAERGAEKRRLSLATQELTSDQLIVSTPAGLRMNHFYSCSEKLENSFQSRLEKNCMKLSTLSKSHLFAGVLGLASLVGPIVPQLQAVQLNVAEHQQEANPGNGLRTTSTAPEQAKAASLALPLHFEANQGQTSSHVQFLSRGSGYTLFLTPGEAVFSLYKPALKTKDLKQGIHRNMDNSAKMSRTVMKMKLVGSNSEAQTVGLKALPGKSHYLKGSDAQRWNIDIPTYGQVKYHGVYPGVDLVYYGQQGQLEYDFVVSPQADPGIIQLAFEGAEQLTINTQGDLVLSTQGGDVHVRKPYVYQEVDGARQPVAGSYLLIEQEATDSETRIPNVGFQVAAYDSSKPLVIDPIVAYSTYLGGNGYDYGTDVAADAAGNIYIAGYTFSVDFPTSGGYDTTFSAPIDGFITKLSTTTGLLYSTYLGGSGTDAIDALAVDALGNAYVTGNTLSLNFPTTANAFQSSFAGGDIGGDAFVTKLSANGSGLLYSTYLGGSSYDFGTGITKDDSGHIYVVGYTYSSNFPKTAQAFDKTLGGGLDAFVAKLNPAVQKPFSKNNLPLVYSTYLGGSGAEQGNGIAVNTLGQAYVTGTTGSTNFPVKAPTIICVKFPCPLPFPFQSQNKGSIDAFVTKLNSTGSGLMYSTYLGGSQDDEGFAIAVNTQGQAHIAGYTGSADFPLVNAAQWNFQGSPTGLTGDAFLSKFNPNGTGLLYSTYLGGTGDETAMDIAVDNLGNAYIVGTTDSPNFPMVNALQPVFNGGSSGLSFPESGDVFVTKVNTLAAGPVSCVFSTYFGGSGGDSGNGISLDMANNVYIAGTTSSVDLLTTPDAYDEIGAAATDAFAAEISGF